MIDHLEGRDPITFDIDDPNGPERFRENVAHSVHFHIFPKQTMTISFTDDELADLAHTILDRLYGPGGWYIG